MASMHIDVIVPTFNRQSVLERAILSVLNQTHQDFLLHVVDDGSNDETHLILSKYQTHPKVKIHTKENGGVSSARNFAVKHSSAQWISFLDSDDEWLPGKLEAQVRFLKAHPDISFIHTEEIWVRNGVRVNPKVKHQKSSENLFYRSLDFCLISPSTVMMKRETFLKHGGFNEEFTVCEDYDLWLKVLLEENVGFISDAHTVKYGGHDDQLSTQFVAMDYWRIKSLCSLYQNAKLNEEQKKSITEVLKKKGEILLKGYIKYQNEKAHDEIKGLLDRTISYS